MKSGTENRPEDPLKLWRPSPRGGPEALQIEGTATSTTNVSTATTSSAATPTPTRTPPPEKEGANSPDRFDQPPVMPRLSPSATNSENKDTKGQKREQDVLEGDDLGEFVKKLTGQPGKPKMPYGGHSSGQPLLTPRTDRSDIGSDTPRSKTKDSADSVPGSARGAGVGPLPLDPSDLHPSDLRRAEARHGRSSVVGPLPLDPPKSARSQRSQETRSTDVPPLDELFATLASARGSNPSPFPSPPQTARGSPSGRSEKKSVSSEAQAMIQDLGATGGVWHSENPDNDEHQEALARAFREEQMSEKLSRFCRMYRKGQMITKISQKGTRLRRRCIVDARRHALVIVGAKGPRSYPFAYMLDVDLDQVWNPNGQLETLMIINLGDHVFRTGKDKERSKENVSHKKKQLKSCFSKSAHKDGENLRFIFDDAQHAKFFAACVELIAQSSAALFHT